VLSVPTYISIFYHNIKNDLKLISCIFKCCYIRMKRLIISLVDKQSRNLYNILNSMCIMFYNMSMEGKMVWQLLIKSWQ